MKLVRLKVSNFMSIEDIDITLDKVGMNLVLGKNLDDKRFDSNGSAKSALFEAMAWGLFGELLRDMVITDAIRNKPTLQDKMKVSVLVDPEDGTDRVWFERTRTKRSHILTATTEKGTLLFPANSVTDVQPQINNWLGLDFKTFTNSVYFGKGLVKFFMASNDTERKDLLETILQIVSFEDALDRAKALSKKCVEDIGEQNTALAVSVALKDEKIRYLESVEKNLEDIVKKINDEEFVFESKKARFLDDKIKLTTSKEKLDLLLTTAKTSYDSEYKKFTEEHEAKTKQLDKELEESISNVEATYNNSISNARNDNKKIMDGIAGATRQLANVHAFYLAKSVEIEKEAARITGHIESINKDKDHALSLIGESLCKECLQTIPNEHRALLVDKYDKELSDLSGGLLALDKKLEENNEGLEKNYTLPSRILAERSANIVTSHNMTIEAMQSEKRQLVSNLNKKSTQDKMKASNVYIESLKKIQDEYNDNTNKWIKLKGNYSVDIALIEKEFATISNERAERHLSWGRLKKQVVEANEDLERLHKQLEYAEDRIDAINLVKERTDFWIEGFGPRGIKSFVFESALPYLTARTNHYSSYLTGGTVTIDIAPTTVVKSTGSVKEKLTVSAINSHGANVYAGNSDGERRRIDICVLLALQDLISTRASKTWNTLIFDEIFDALDKTGIEHVIDMLRTFRDKSIYIISHSEDIKKHFDTAITIKKLNDVSSIKDIV